MKFIEAKQQFIQAWGTLGSNWGTNRTMSQIHALLLVSPEPMSTEDIMKELSISRGNANMNLRDLMDWELVHKILKPGERKEYFQAEKDIWKVARQVAKERKKRELDPMVKVLEKVKEVDGDPKDKNIKAFKSSVDDILKVANNADQSIDMMIRAEESWFWSNIMRLVK